MQPETEKLEVWKNMSGEMIPFSADDQQMRVTVSVVIKVFPAIVHIYECTLNTKETVHSFCIEQQC